VNGRAVARQGGFTLLEMLVVVAVLGFLMIGLTQGVRTGLTLWEAQSRRMGETAELDAAARVLRALRRRSAHRARNHPARRHHARAEPRSDGLALDPASP
jgi:prepilin-type N-terminal cleavage/methylation domain-containing protein